MFVTVRKASQGREYKTHHDRLINLIISRKFVSRYSAGAVVPPVFHANPSEILETHEMDFHSVADPAVALQRFHHEITGKPRCDPDFDYSGSFCDSGLSLHSSSLQVFDCLFALVSVAFKTC